MIRDLLHFGRKPLVVRGFSLVRRNGTENCCRESFGNCLYAATRQPPRLANIKGKPTKRIVCTLTTKRQSASPRLAKVDGDSTKRIVRILTAKSAAGSHLTYEKELLNSGKNSHFYKTNHPGLPHGLPPYDPDNNTFCIYAQNEIMVQFPLLLFAN